MADMRPKLKGKKSNLMYSTMIYKSAAASSKGNGTARPVLYYFFLIYIYTLKPFGLGIKT